MAKLKAVNHYNSDELYGYMFECPGCGSAHMPVVNNKQPDGPEWTFNEDLDRPTFAPSLLVRWEEYQGEGQPTKKHVCHSFIQDGQIQFLNDCTHSLAGKTVDLPEVGT